nr:hypothetical protein [Pseudomonas sp.]
MPTAQRAAAVGAGRASGRGLQRSGRVGTRLDRLLQLLDRRCGLRRGQGHIGASVGQGCAPLAVTAKVQVTAIGQLQGNGAAHAGEYLLACIQAITLDKYTANAFWGYRDNLANNAFDDGNNRAHGALQITLPVHVEGARA